MTKFWGIPLLVWAGVCLIVAIIWLIVWPADRVTTGGWSFIVIRWFHALTWFLLGLAAATASLPSLHSSSVPRLVALSGLVVYLIFLFTVIFTKPVN